MRASFRPPPLDRSESNVLAANTIFLGSIVLDALTAIDPVVPSNVPASMRATAVVTVVCLAAPPIRQWTIFAQRGVFAFAVACVAFVGRHTGSVGVRVWDAVYVYLAIAIVCVAFWNGGIDAISDELTGTSRGSPSYTLRDQFNSLSVAQLLYASLRLLRASVLLPLRTNGIDHQFAPGVGCSDSVVSAVSSFGASIGVGLAVALLIRISFRRLGTRAMFLPIVVCAFAQLVAAFVDTLAVAQKRSIPSNFPTLFEHPDVADTNLARRTRRFALVGGCPSILWLNGLGTLALARGSSLQSLPVKDACETRREHSNATAYAIASLAVCAATTVWYASFDGSDAITDYATIAALVGLALLVLKDRFVGSVVFLGAVAIEEASLLVSQGWHAVFVHFTHCSITVSSVLLCLYLVATFLEDWSDFAEGLFCNEFDKHVAVVRALLAAAGTSVSVFLYLGTCCLYATYDGSVLLPTLRGGTRHATRDALASMLQHFFPALVWFPLYAEHVTTLQFRFRMHVAVWVGALFLPGALWGVALIASDQSVWNSVSWYTSPAFVFSIVVVGVVPWIAAAWA